MASFFKTFLAALLAIFVFIMLGVLIVMGLASSGEKTFKAEDNSVLHLTFENEITDRHYENRLDIDFSTFQPIQKDGLNFILTQIKKAQVDPKVSGIFMDVKSPMAGLATMQEIRDALVEFKSSGKWIVSYSDFYTQGGYYLASVADEIYMEPEGMLEFKGLRSNVMFMKGLLDKVGVDVQVIRPKNNRFKSAVEPFLLDSMSTSNEEQLDKILSSIWDHIAYDIAKSRNMTEEEVNLAAAELLSRNAKSAQEGGLIDGVKYRDEVMAELMSKTRVELEEDLELVTLRQYSQSNVEEFTDLEKLYAKDKIAVIYGIGEIGMGKGNTESIGSDGLAELISEARKDSSVKAIVLRVNSPGGSALASDVIWREMTLAKETNGRNELAPGDVDALLAKVIEALMTRGKASLGDKTVLDSLEAIRLGAADLAEGAELPEIAVAAARSALEDYRDKPNRIGRARMFAEKSIGMDDPGMVAVLRIVGGGIDPG